MIKKLIGIIVAVAVIVIIVVAAVRRDNFRSMVLRDEMLNGVRPTEEPSRFAAFLVRHAVHCPVDVAVFVPAGMSQVPEEQMGERQQP